MQVSPRSRFRGICHGATTMAMLWIVFGSVSAIDPVNVTGRGKIAIEGYDPVAYFTLGEPVKGNEAYEHVWMGARWRFASAEHRDAFAADPERFAPQYGGYCSWAVSQGYTAGIDPKAWRIVDGKLYLNYSPKVQRRWAQNLEATIAKADANWPAIRDGK